MCDNFIASVVIRLLPIQISPKNGSELTAVVFSSGSLAALCSDTIQYPPRSVLIFDGCSLLCFILRRAFSLPCPSLLLLKCVISPSHHQRTSKNCAPTPFLKSKNPRRGSGEAFAKRRSQKRQHLEKRKRDQDVIIPRNVSTFVAGEERKKKKQPPLSDSVFIAYIRPVNVCP